MEALLRNQSRFGEHASAQCAKIRAFSALLDHPNPLPGEPNYDHLSLETV